MVATIETVKIGDKDIVCMDLKYGYIIGITEANPETKHGTVVNGTTLSEEDVMELRVSEVDELYKTITRLTYPDLFNEDGTEKEIPEDKGDKKKVSRT